MTIEYIMNHTPAQVAAEHTAEEIAAEFNSYSPFSVDEAAGLLFGGTDPEELADCTPDPTFTRCEQLLVEWYDECDNERPCDAKSLELTYMLYTALYIRWGMDEADDE